MQFRTSGCAVQVEVIEEDERFQSLAEVARAHQPHDLPIAATAGAVHNCSNCHCHAFFVAVNPCGVWYSGARCKAAISS